MNNETLDQQLAAFSAAPGIYLFGAALIAIFVWWLRSYIGKAMVDALKEQISVKEDRLKFAHDQAEAFRAEIQKQKLEREQELKLIAMLKPWPEARAPAGPRGPDPVARLEEHSLTATNSLANLERIANSISETTRVLVLPADKEVWGVKKKK